MDVFNKQYIAVFMTLILQVIFIYMDSMIGQAILIILFVIGVALQRTVWMPLVKTIFDKLLHKL